MNLKSGSLDYHKEIQLRDGTTAVIRPICSTDKAAFQAFFNRLSGKTVFLRYQYLKKPLSEVELEDFCTFTYPEKLVLVAEIEHSKKHIVGIGSYDRLDNLTVAEAAFLVEDDEQNKGVGTQLLRHLSILAMQNDVHYFTAEVLSVNERMISIFKKADPSLMLENDGTSCTINMELRPVSPPPADIP